MVASLSFTELFTVQPKLVFTILSLKGFLSVFCEGGVMAVRLPGNFSGQIKSSQVKREKVKSEKGNVRLVKSGQVRSGQVKSSLVRSSQSRSCSELFRTKNFLGPNIFQNYFFCVDVPY